MATEKQLAANRANAQKSTGPVTPDGKAASSQNALKSGIYAKALIIRGEDPAELEALRDQFHQLYPSDAVDECALVDTLVANEWTLRRLRKCCTDLWEISFQLAGGSELVHTHPVLGSAFADNQWGFLNVQRLINAAERSFRRTLIDIQRLRKLRQTAQPVDPAPASPELASFPQIPASQPDSSPDPQPHALNPAADARPDPAVPASPQSEPRP